MRKILSVILVLVLVPGAAWATTSFTRLKTWTAEKLYAADLNSEFDNVGTYLNNNIAWVTNITASAADLNQLDNNRFVNASEFIAAIEDSASVTMNTGFVYTNHGKAIFDSLAADTLYATAQGPTKVQFGAGLVPDTTVGKGRYLGKPTGRFEAWLDTANVSVVVPAKIDTSAAFVIGRANIQTGAVDSTKIANNMVSYANQGLLSIDSLKIRAVAVSGGNLASTLSGRKNFTSGIRGSGVETDTIYSGASNKLMFKVNGQDSVLQLQTSSGGLLTLGGEAANMPYILLQAKPASTGGYIGLNIYEGNASGAANNMQYAVVYDAANNRFAIFSANIDGASTDADVIRIPDGQLTVDGNSTFDDNAFDYVCPVCYRHTLEPGRCSKDGTVMIWNDDVEMLREAIHNFGKSNLKTTLEKVGVITRYSDGSLFTSMNKAPWAAFSAIVQQSDRITRENGELHTRIDALERQGDTHPALWIVAGIAIGVIAMLRKKRLLVVVLALGIAQGGAYALSLEQKILIVFNTRGTGHMLKSTQAIMDSVRVVFNTTDSRVSEDSVQVSIRTLETEGLLRQGNNKIHLTRIGRDSSQKLP